MTKKKKNRFFLIRCSESSEIRICHLKLRIILRYEVIKHLMKQSFFIG